jgi:iron-sulfur cluster assembly accessory protein
MQPSSSILAVEDLQFEADGVTVISDEMTLDMISGSKIVYKEEMIRSAFEVVNNPMAEGGCSCGTSFTPKN